jgi:hypothetical protein
MKTRLLILIALLFTVLSLSAQPVPGNPVTTVTSITICPGTPSIDIPVTVNDFNAVGSISFEFAYAGSEIYSPSIIYINPGIVAWGNFEANTATSGSIIISAYDTDVSETVEGLTLSDGSILFTLRFSVGEILDYSIISFVENSEGTTCEITGIGPEYIPFTDTPTTTYYIDGIVEMIDFGAGLIGSDQYICEDGDVESFISIVNASGEGAITYQWQSGITGETEGFSDIEGATSPTLDPGAISADTWYRRQATATFNETACSYYSNVVLVTVINFEPGVIAEDQSICEGDNVTALTSTSGASGDGTITYQWQLSTAGESEGFSDIEGATSAAFDPDVISADTWYRREATASLGGTECTEYSNVIKVTVVNFAPGAIATSQFICEGDDVAAFTSTADATGDGTFSYQWQYSTVSENSDFLDIEGATSTTYDPGQITADTWYRREATSSSDGIECTEYSNVILVTVINFSPGAIAAEQFICEGDDVAALTSVSGASGDGAFSYQWQLSTTGESESYSNIEGATADTYDPGTISQDTWYRREAIASLGGAECTGYSNTAQVSVINLAPGTIAGGETLCEGDDAAAFASTVGASGDGSIAYQWQMSTTGESEGYSDIEGATAAIYDPATLNTDTWYRREATASLGGSSCAGFSNVILLNVVNFDPGEIAADQFIGEDSDAAAFTSTSDATGDGTFSYQWQLSTTNGSEGFSDIAEATAIIYDPGVINEDTWYRREATATVGETQCVKLSNVIKVTVINFVPGVIAAGQLICEGEDVAAFTSETDASGDGTITYQWQASITGESEGFSHIDGATSPTYDPGVISADTWYRREATASLGGTECSAYSNVLAVAVIHFNPGVIATSQSVCLGDNAAAFTSESDASGEGTFTYQWQISTTSDTEGFSNIEGATTTVYDPGAVSVNTWYRREVTSLYSETECVNYSNVVMVTANPRQSISGTFYYYHSSGNILMTGQNITVNLYKTSDAAHETLLGTVITDENAYYEFSDLCPECDYDVVPTTPQPTSGAINTTDAAQTNYWGAHPTTIEKVRFYSGDVGTSGQDHDLSVNSTDAGRIQQHFVYGYPFDRTWTFWCAGTTISANPAFVCYPAIPLPAGSNVTANMYALCTGDFNRSFNPTMLKSASSTLELLHQSNRIAGINQVIDLPVHLLNTSQVGAISLILNFPADLVEIQDVIMNQAGGQLDWTVKGQEIRIGWNSSNPLYLTAGAELFTLRLKTTDNFIVGNSIRITLASDPLNELADNQYNVIGDAQLGVAVIDAAAVGIDENKVSDNLYLGNYPNPFGNSTNIIYTLPEDGMVNLSIYCILGNKVATLVNESQHAGNYEISHGLADLPAGIYLATLKVKSVGYEMVRTIRLLKKN